MSRETRLRQGYGGQAGPFGHVLRDVLQGLLVLAVDFVADVGVKAGGMPLKHVLDDARAEAGLIQEEAEDAVLEQPFKGLVGQRGGVKEDS